MFGNEAELTCKIMIFHFLSSSHQLSPSDSSPDLTQTISLLPDNVKANHLSAHNIVAPLPAVEMLELPLALVAITFAKTL